MYIVRVFENLGDEPQWTSTLLYKSEEKARERFDKECNEALYTIVGNLRHSDLQDDIEDLPDDELVRVKSGGEPKPLWMVIYSNFTDENVMIDIAPIEFEDEE